MNTEADRFRVICPTLSEKNDSHAALADAALAAARQRRQRVESPHGTLACQEGRNPKPCLRSQVAREGVKKPWL
jgi:hypothetical protein